MDGAAFIAGCEAPEVPHSSEGALKTIAVDVSECVMWDDHLARSVGQDDGLCSHGGDHLSQGIAVIGLVGENRLANLPFQKSRCLRDAAKHSAAFGTIIKHDGLPGRIHVG